MIYDVDMMMLNYWWE